MGHIMIKPAMSNEPCLQKPLGSLISLIEKCYKLQNTRKQAFVDRIICRLSGEVSTFENKFYLVMAPVLSSSSHIPLDVYVCFLFMNKTK